MPVYAVSFRIGSQADAGGRYKSVTDKIEQIAGHHTWKDTTSFYIFKSDLGLSDVTAKINLESDFSGLYDDLLVIDLADGKFLTRGQDRDVSTLRLLMLQR